MNIEGPAELVDCRILRCHAREFGGGLYVGGSNAFTKMTGGTISECSATYGGGVSTSTTRAEVSLVNVLITKCRATGDAEDKDPANGDGHGGGGDHVSLNAVFTMTGGSIRDCEATGGGGLRVTGDATQVRLRRMTLQRCTHRHHFLSWPNSAGCIYISDGNVSLVDVSLEECGSDDMCTPYALSHSGGKLHAERVRVRQPNPNFPVVLGCRASAVFCAITRQSISKWTDSVISDCPGVCLVSEYGRTMLTRTSIVRASKGVHFEGYSGFFTMIDSHIADCEEGCLEQRSPGTMVVRNSTLHNCSAPGEAFPYIKLHEKVTNLHSELLTLELSCEEDPSTALISVFDDGALAAPLNVRGLRIIAPAACASTNFSVFSDHVRPVACSDDYFAPCDAAATCTEVSPLLSVSTLLKTVDCSCEGDPNPTATSPALAPYGFDPIAVGLPDLPIDYCVRPKPPNQTSTSTTGPVLTPPGPLLPRTGHTTCGTHGQPQWLHAGGGTPALQD